VKSVDLMHPIIIFNMFFLDELLTMVVWVKNMIYTTITCLVVDIK